MIGGRGRIGSKVAEIAKVFGMNILIQTRQVAQNSITSTSTSPSVTYTESIEELLKVSDFVSLHCPLNTETRHMINKTTLGLMKPTAYLINTARGGLINEIDLVEALTNQTIAGMLLSIYTCFYVLLYIVILLYCI